jgi:hypothetical protein
VGSPIGSQENAADARTSGAASLRSSRSIGRPRSSAILPSASAARARVAASLDRAAADKISASNALRSSSARRSASASADEAHLGGAVLGAGARGRPAEGALGAPAHRPRSDAANRTQRRFHPLREIIPSPCQGGEPDERPDYKDELRVMS